MSNDISTAYTKDRNRRIQKMAKINESLIIGVDFSENGDTGILVVGRQKKGKVDIINAF